MYYILGHNNIYLSSITSGYIQSPDYYPPTYPDIALFNWTLTTDANETIIIKIESLDLKVSVNGKCENYLRFSSNLYSELPNIEEYCDSSYPKYIHHQSPVLIIEFRSIRHGPNRPYSTFRLGYSLCKYIKYNNSIREFH